jgi:hypothetical protein
MAAGYACRLARPFLAGLLRHWVAIALDSNWAALAIRQLFRAFFAARLVAFLGITARAAKFAP